MLLASRFPSSRPKWSATSMRCREGSARKASMSSCRILFCGSDVTNIMRFSHASAMRLGTLRSSKAEEPTEYCEKALPFTSRASYCASGKRSSSRARSTVRCVRRLLYMKTALASRVDLRAGRRKRSTADFAFTITVCCSPCRRERTGSTGDFQRAASCLVLAFAKVEAIQDSSGGSLSTKVSSISARARESSVEPVWPRWKMKCTPSPTVRPPTFSPRSLPHVVSS
mmetsp:Transcript_35076/g.79626  ORF Transcript_35076/g.79626 Transcript_35076/m.79626 type:complete len:227 (-) Transcript_35076:287-967(-)